MLTGNIGDLGKNYSSKNHGLPLWICRKEGRQTYLGAYSAKMISKDTRQCFPHTFFSQGQRNQVDKEVGYHSPLLSIQVNEPTSFSLASLTSFSLVLFSPLGLA